jgi:hypothetical protein
VTSGVHLDITQGPSQSTTPNNRSLWNQIAVRQTFTQVSEDPISALSYWSRSTVSQARIARSTESQTIYPYLYPPTPVFPIQVLQPGDTIGPSLNWQVSAPRSAGSTASGNLLSLPANGFFAVKFSMPDGTHYGYIEIHDGFYPHSWGYESLPDTPIPIPGGCGSSDYNGDGDYGTDADIEAFFACLGGDCCATCFAGGSDFNADGDYGTDADIEAFFRVLSGGAC